MITKELKFFSVMDTDLNVLGTKLQIHWKELKFLKVKKISWNWRHCVPNACHYILAITSPAYIVARLENVNDVSSEFFCPVKKCFEYADEACEKGKAMPEYKKEYKEIEAR